MVPVSVLSAGACLAAVCISALAIMRLGSITALKTWAVILDILCRRLAADLLSDTAVDALTYRRALRVLYVLCMCCMSRLMLVFRWL